jgi:hypothetical protein
LSLFDAFRSLLDTQSVRPLSFAVARMRFGLVWRHVRCFAAQTAAA